MVSALGQMIIIFKVGKGRERSGLDFSTEIVSSSACNIDLSKRKREILGF